jgi:hypothetical protein
MIRVVLNIKGHMCICTDTYVTIVNSYEIKDEDIHDFVSELKEEIDKYSKLRYLYKRSNISWEREWIAHNKLYRKGLFIDHTRDVDLDENEPIYRLIIYRILGNNKRNIN